MIRLKRLREEREESQAQLASALGVHPSSIGNWENGMRQMDYDMLIKIADYYGVTVDYLLGHDVDMKQLPKDEIRLLAIYRNLSQHGKDGVRNIIEHLYQYEP